MQRLSILAVTGLLCLNGTVCAQGVQSLSSDSQKTVELKAVAIVSTRATSETPVTFTNVDKAQLEKVNTGVDIPFLLNMTPSLVTTSDAGMGMGYTTLRIRGVDASRINITTNGIPMNDPEEQGFFWVDAPDLASSLRSIQVQRGAGTSTNGAAAFGATVNMQTDGQPVQPHAEFRGSYGTYNTEKETYSLGTGMLGGHFALDARLSNMKTDGYLQRADAKMNSYLVQGGYYNDNTFLKLIVFGGKERTYHAWDYSWKPGMDRRYNSCGYMFTDGEGKDHYYNNQTDNYLQTNYQALLHHEFSRHWKLNAALHNTYGEGYYEQYKRKQYLVEYGMQDYGTRSDLVRQKKMKNTLTGGVFSLDYEKGTKRVSLGGGMNRFVGDHYGKVIWVKNMDGTATPASGSGSATAVPNQEYYNNRGFKTDGNLYLKASEEILTGLRLYADLQYRHIHYTIKGSDDIYNYATAAMRSLDVRKNFDFLNPKAGLNWQIDKNQRAYFSYGVAQREPSRNCYTNTVELSGKPLPELNPKAERFMDYELGYQYQKDIWSVGANLYYMDYKDQLVQNGLLNDIGEAVFVNVPNSYRTGIELQAAVKPMRWLDWDINATLSRNRIQHYTQQDAVMDDNWNVLDTRSTYYKSATIAFSPAFVLNNGLDFHWKGWNALLQSHYVSRQYLTNTHEKAISIDPYFVNDLHVNYSFKVKGVKGITVGATVYNLLNEKYESNGWGSRAFFQDGASVSYSPDYGLSTQAGIHVMGHVSIAF
ncbi:MAG: TonB-dependent receptor [Bacteroidaceae bacterium]|nr:TonB-dependent receptor [Bacteroidaceae bacterium]